MIISPSSLPIIRPLAGRLEVAPLLQEELLRRRLIADLMLLVVRLDEVEYDGVGLPERGARVRVFEGGHASVWIHVRVRRFLETVHCD